MKKISKSSRHAERYTVEARAFTVGALLGAALACALAMLGSPAFAADDPSSDEGAKPHAKRTIADKPLASLGEETITLGDIDPDTAFQIYRQRLDSYTLIVRAVNDAVERRLLAREAKQRDISPEELNRLLEAEADPVTPAEVDAYLEKNPALAAEANARERVAYYLTEQRRIQTRLDFVNALRERARFKMLLDPPEQPRLALSTDGAPARGPKDAPIVLVHFASFTSEPSAASAESIQHLERELPGRIRWLHRSLPREGDDLSRAAAQLAAEAAEKGKFWQLHDRLFALRGKVEAADLDRIAAELDIPAVRPGDTCYLESIERDADEARRIGIAQEPVIFVNGRYFSPTLPYAQLRALLSDELGEGAAPPPPSPPSPSPSAAPPANRSPKSQKSAGSSN